MNGKAQVVTKSIGNYKIMLNYTILMMCKDNIK